MVGNAAAQTSVIQIQGFSKTPPDEGWDGVFVMKTK
tara:strand:+ start:154 stop:261 length:108 start_codon:yes stop_codon:yes gene_type:complete